MNIGIILIGFGDMTFEEQLRTVKEIGFNSVEFAVSQVLNDDVEDPEAEAESTRALVESHGLKVCAVGSLNDFVLLDPDAVQAQVKYMDRVCGLIKRLGAKAVRTEGGQPKDEVPQSKWAEAIGECLKRCSDIAERHELNLALDNHGWVTNIGEIQLEAIQKAGSPRIGATLDTSNYRWFGNDLDTVHRYIKMIAPYAHHVHLKDGDGRGGKVADYKATALGEGEIDITMAIRELQANDYAGAWTSEYEGPEGAVVGAQKNHAFIKKTLAG